MKIISFSGVDGSGKSSQLASLQAKLLQDGKKIFYFHSIEFSLANKIARYIKGRENFQPGKEKAQTKASWLSLHIRIKFLFIDMIRFWFLRKKLERENYDFLLSDRFFYDSIINIEYLMEGISFFKWSLVLGTKILNHCMPKADRAFYLDVSPEAILARDRVPEQGAEYLKSKIRLFKRKIEIWDMVVIDAEKEKGVVTQKILEKI